MNELNAAIYTRLQGTSGLTSLLAGTTAIYNGQAPETQAYPYVVYSIQGGGDMNIEPHRAKNMVYFVRCYSVDSAREAGSIDAQLDSALHLNPLTVSGWTNIWLAREQDIEIVENEPSGRQVWTCGGMYRVRLSK